MNILAVTCMRNEAPYCLEWIAHHRAAGVTDFLIYTHDCDDGTDAMLDLLPGVTHLPFTPEPGKSVQWRAMQFADKHPAMAAADWVIFFDCDEFLCLDAPLSTFADLIASVPPETDAIALPWRVFGSSGQTEWHDGLVLDRFTMAAPDPFHLPAGHFFKTLFRPAKFQKLGVHRPKTKRDQTPFWSLGGAGPAPAHFVTDDKRINLFGLLPNAPPARLNHYSTRSATEFMIKRARGLPNRRTKNIDLGYWAERNFSTGKDDTIQHMLPATKADLAALMEMDGIADLLAKGCAIHRDVFHDQMKDRSAAMMYLHLSLLTGSTAPDVKQIAAHLSRLQNSD